MMIGYSNDVGYIGRLLLAQDGTWPIDGDVTAELRHKLSESLWWTFVLANKLNIDIDAAFTETMGSIHANLTRTIQRTDPVEHAAPSEKVAPVDNTEPGPATA